MKALCCAVFCAVQCYLSTRVYYELLCVHEQYMTNSVAHDKGECIAGYCCVIHPSVFFSAEFVSWIRDSWSISDEGSVAVVQNSSDKHRGS